MDSATITSIEPGLITAGTFLDRFADPAQSPAGDEPADGPGEFVKSAVLQLEQAIAPGARPGVDQAETEHLEQMVSRARNLASLLDMDRPEQALQYAMTLRESVDHARNRIDEGKARWISPYLAAGSIYFAVLAAAGERRDADLAEFRGDVDQVRAMILDDVVPRMIERGVKVPWRTVADFMRGDGGAAHELLGHLALDEAAPPATSAAGSPPTLAGVDPGIHALAVEILDPVNGAFVAPNIPPRKAEGARERVLPLADPGDALVALVDLTVFGGAKDCVAIFSGYCIIGSDAALIRLEYDHLPAVITSHGYHLEMSGERYFLLEKARAAAVAAFLNAVQLRTLASGEPPSS